MSLEGDIQRLARGNCANFSDTYDSNCCLLELDGCLTCRYFRDRAEGTRCHYFETHVLPADSALEARYFGGSKKNIIRCDMCRQEYVKTSNRQRYCVGCRDRAETVGRRRRDARYRRKKATV
jgi:hypothetical protein